MSELVSELILPSATVFISDQETRRRGETGLRAVVLMMINVTL